MIRRAQTVFWLTALVAGAFVAASAGQGPPGGSPPGLDKAIAAKEKHAQEMLDKPGVAGIGVALNKQGKPVIEIFKEKNDVPDLPATLEDVPVESITTGLIQPRSLPTDRFPRPVPIGVSGGLSGVATGTMGARVTDGTNVYVLSNNHVLAGVNTASIGDPIIQPGDVDGGSDPGDRIATLAAYQTIDFNGGTNTMDAAIALTTTANMGVATPADGYGAPSALTTPAFIGQAVLKYGRTTGLQLGSVTTTDVSVDVCYIAFGDFCLQQARFAGQFSISPGPFSAPGDSGSLIVSQSGNQPVGLLFAGGDGLTIATPIDVVLNRFGVTVDGSPPTEGPPSAPPGLSALSGAGNVTLSWSASAFNGGSPITNYKVYRGTSAGTETFFANAGTSTTFVDSGLTNGVTYYYKVSAENVYGESPLSSEVSATPAGLVPPGMPLPTIDNFDRLNENPLSDAGRWTNGVIGSAETGLYIPSNWLACSRSTTCTAWRNSAQYGPDSESWARIATLPGTANSVRLYVRIQQPGSTAADGYELRTIQQAGTDQVLLERVDNGTLVTRLTINQELAAGDTLLLRAKGTTIEAWRNDGSSWSRLGLVTDSTYGAGGYTGIGLRGTTGRLEDFGARSLGLNPPGSPSALAATVGDGNAALSWTTPSFDGGSPITNYKVYRGTSAGTETFFANAGTSTTFVDSGLTNGVTYYYKVSAENVYGESPLSSEVSATPAGLVPPGMPLPTIDNFDRLNENPLSDAGRWTNGVIGSAETGLYIPSNWLACSRSTTCTAWRNSAQYGPDSESWARIATLPGTANSVRLYVRIQQPGSTAADGYELRTIQQAGTDQVLLERVDNGTLVTRLTINQELAAGDTLLLRAKGTTIEAWRNDGSSWSRLGLVTDSTYGAGGYTGIGLRGTTGRLEDFGARTMGTPAPTAPSAPQSLGASAGNNQVSLSWSAPSSNGGSALTTYTVYRSTTSGVLGSALSPGPGLSTSYTDTTAANGTTYYYLVKASNAVGESLSSNEAPATPSAPATAPSAPQSLGASAGNNQVSLSWSAPSSNGGSALTTYTVYRSTTSGVLGSALSPGPGLSTSYTDTTAANGTTYYYLVKASNAVGESLSSNEAPATPSAPATAPSAPQSLGASAGNNQVSLSWSAPSSNGGSALTTYTVYRSTTSGVLGSALSPGPGLSTSYTDTTAANGTTYYYLVKASNAVGESLSSNEAPATPSAPATAPSAPQSLGASAGNNQVSLSWSAPSSNGGSALTTYTVYRSTTSGVLGSALSPGPGLSTSYTDTTAANGTTYYYLVKASNAVGESLSSNEAPATPTGNVPPVEPLPVVDSSTGGTRTHCLMPAAGRTARRVGRDRSSGHIDRARVHSRHDVQCVADNAMYGPDVEVWARRHDAARKQQLSSGFWRASNRRERPGTTGTCCARTSIRDRPGVSRADRQRRRSSGCSRCRRSSRWGDTLVSESRKGATLEAWHRRGTTWTKLGAASDSRLPAAGRVGVGIRGRPGGWTTSARASRGLSAPSSSARTGAGSAASIARTTSTSPSIETPSSSRSTRSR